MGTIRENSSEMLGAAAPELGEDRARVPSEILRDEAEVIRKRRQASGIEPDAPLMGLALSGGGIRSATFNLGLLQGFSQHGLLRCLDYLSTVSGGGYLGGWWTAWLSRPERKPQDGLFPPPEQIEPLASRAPPSRLAGHDPVKHLRLFSNFLTPRPGALSPDSWRAAAIITRNLLLTWLLLLPVLFSVLCLVQLVEVAHPTTGVLYLASDDFPDRMKAVGPTFLALGVIWVGLMTLLISAWLLVSLNFARSLPHLIGASVGQGMFIGLFLIHPHVASAIGTSTSILTMGGLASLALAAIYLAFEYVPALGRLRDVARNRLVRAHAVVLFCFAAILAVLAFAAFGDLVVRACLTEAKDAVTQASGAIAVLASVGSALFSGMKMFPTGGADATHQQEPSRLSRLILVVAPYLVILVLGLIGAYLARLTILATQGALLEWVSAGVLAGGAFCQILALAGMSHHTQEGWKTGVVAAVLLGLWMQRELLTSYPRAMVLVALALLLVTIVVRLLSPSPEGMMERPFSPGGRRGLQALVGLGLVGASALIWLDEAFWLAPVPEQAFTINRSAVVLLLITVAVIGFGTWQRLLTRGNLLLVSAGSTAAVVLAIINLFHDDGWVSGTAAVLGVAGTSLTAGLGLGWMIDPNLVSLHGFYRARLIRAYLGASNTHRAHSHAGITDAVKGDDLRLIHCISSCWRGGPYPLFNTTLNLTATDDLATSQRGAASFILSPLYCGSASTGYRPTRQYMGGQLSLGTAVAISGAAASPEAGMLRLSTAQAMLFTLLNVRLGFWAPNPGKASWRTPQARLWTFYALREFLSQTDGESSYCYLSDGGHFENSGIYELVQRACQLIVVSDCGLDPHPPRLEDLGAAVRMCRIDFGAELEIDTSKLSAEAPSPVVVGTITYAEEHLRQLGIAPEKLGSRKTGLVLWVKPTRPSDQVAQGVAADVLQYSRANKDFPQQSTADLYYDEAQFESYRKLGLWTAGEVARKLAELHVPPGQQGQPLEPLITSKVG